MSPRRFRSLAVASVVVLVAAGAAAVPASPAAAAACSAFFDADGDGFDDLAVGVPGEDVALAASVSNAGTVTLVHGDAAGRFGTDGSSVLAQEDVGLVSQVGDRFGAAVATADLNGDGCADLAVGVPGESGGAGAVVVVWGTPGGLDLGRPEVLRQGDAPVGSAAEAGDGFGTSLAVAGSLPTGGAAALWIGSPGEDVGKTRDAGMVTEVKASAGGLPGAAGVTHVHQDTPGVPGAGETGDRFGERLSGGGRTLLVGVPREDVGSRTDAGGYYAFTVSSRTWHAYTQDTPGVPGAAEAGDRFGSAVALGVGCASATDESWAVGAPGEDIGSVKNAGLVTLRDRGSGLGSTLRQGAGGVPGPAEAGDAFGSALVDAGVLVASSPKEDVGTDANSGSVTLVELGCTPEGHVGVGSAQTWTQATDGVAGASEPGDLFGRTLGASAVEVGGELQVRLAVGSPGESEGTVAGSGQVTVFDTSPTGLRTSGSFAFGQATAGIDGEPEAGDGFGGSLDAANALVL